MTTFACPKFRFFYSLILSEWTKWHDHSTKTSLAALSHGTIYFFLAFNKMKFGNLVEF